MKFFIQHILVWLYANIKLRMARMNLSSYMLMLAFSLFSQGVLLSASKSIRNLEDDIVSNTFRMGKAFQKEDTAERSVVAPSLEQYKNDESGFSSDDDRNAKVSVCSLPSTALEMKATFIISDHPEVYFVFSFYKWAYMQSLSALR